MKRPRVSPLAYAKHALYTFAHRRQHRREAARRKEEERRFKPDRQLDERINEARFRTDPLADDVMAALFAGGKEELERANEIIRHLIRQEEVPADEIADIVGADTLKHLHDYMNVASQLPEWADMEAIDQAGDVFSRHGIIAFAVLGCASLPAGYTVPEAALVLGFTQQLVAHAKHRLWETSQFLIDVMSQDGLKPTGRGLQAIQRVRLMHAATRYMLLAPSPADHAGETREQHLGHVLHNKKHIGGTWDVDTYGQPIHQAVMSGTILCFSFVTLRSMRTMNVGLTPEEEHAYLHAWNVVGYMMGVEEDFLLPQPETYADAEHLFNHIWRRFQSNQPLRDGIELTAALLSFLEDPLADLPHPLPHLPRMIMRDLMGEEITNLLGVELDFTDEISLRAFLAGIKELDHLERHVYKDLPKTRAASEVLFSKMARAMSGSERKGDRPEFRIPSELATGWRFPEVATDGK